MQKINGKRLKIVAGLLLSLLIVGVAAGVTLAYMVERTPDAKNTFVPVTVDSKPVSTAQGRMAVMNQGDVTAYIRATVTVNWVSLDEEGNAAGTYHMNGPVDGVDFSITYDASGSWKKGTDGFWYYTAPVAAGSLTQDLIVSVVRMTDPPEGYGMSVEIMTTGIQSTPAQAVEQAWNVSLNGDSLLPN